jgi:hypothetical protein
MEMTIRDLWSSNDQEAWKAALGRYQLRLNKKTRPLDELLNDERLVERLRAFTPQQWHEFLRDEYFPWKYDQRWTLQDHVQKMGLDELDQIRKRLLDLGRVVQIFTGQVPDDPAHIRLGLEVADDIPGLGIAGASGLLALMYPKKYGTVDQYVIKALRQVGDYLPEAENLRQIEPECTLTPEVGVLIVKILRRKAADNNRVFQCGNTWTPRKVDMLLWAHRG